MLILMLIILNRGYADIDVSKLRPCAVCHTSAFKTNSVHINVIDYSRIVLANLDNTMQGKTAHIFK